jgi:RNA methyltransferase, TrmH family
MPVRTVESKQNARVKELRQAFAQAGRGARGLAGIEGSKMLEEALRAGLRVKSVFVAKGSERLLAPLRLPREVEILQLPQALLDSALATETPQPVAALVEPPVWSWAHVLGTRPMKTPLIVVLAGIQDPGNLGTILRSAEAFGATSVVSLPGTVSAWNPKAVRASAGSVFRVPVVTASERKCFDELREAGVRILATTVRGAERIDQVEMARSIAIVIGNEGNGVPQEIAGKADEAITIPCPGPVESLNAAMAATVLLYEAARQRSTLVSKPVGSPRNSSKRLLHAMGARR